MAEREARGSEFAPWTEDRAKEIIEGRVRAGGQLVLVLQDLQKVFGYIPNEATALIAEGLNLSRAEVHGVVTFYHDFRRVPSGRHVLKLCRAEACQSMGGDKLAEHASRLLGLSFGEVSKDGSVGLEAVYCLGLCACAPAALFDERPVGRLDEASLDALISEAKA